MRALRLLAASLAILAACDIGTGPEPPTSGNVTRAWTATRCTYRSVADPAVEVELIGVGWEIGLFINDNGQFFYVVTPPGGTEQNTPGTWDIAGSHLILAPTGSGATWDFRASVDEDRMSLRGAAVTYDFDADGTPDPATWNLTLVN